MLRWEHENRGEGPGRLWHPSSRARGLSQPSRGKVLYRRRRTRADSHPDLRPFRDRSNPGQGLYRRHRERVPCRPDHCWGFYPRRLERFLWEVYPLLALGRLG